MKKIIQSIKQAYYLTLSAEKHEEIVWKRLKKLFIDKDWKHGIYEKEKYISAEFEIGQDQMCTYYFFSYDQRFSCQVTVLSGFPVEITSELFILATHFNNLLRRGAVTVDVDKRVVEYQLHQELIVPVLYEQEIYQLLIAHYNTSQDVFKAFLRLAVEGEAPAIIIADLLRELDDRKDQSES
jgi:hypothetical protein